MSVLFSAYNRRSEGVRKEERASRFYRSLSKYRRGEGTAEDFVRVSWNLNAQVLSATQPLPNKADVAFSTDAASGAYSPVFKCVDGAMLVSALSCVVLWLWCSELHSRCA